MLSCRGAHRRRGRRPARRAIRHGEQLERRLPLTVAGNDDTAGVGSNLPFAHPQSPTCGCAGCVMPPPDSFDTRDLEVQVAPRLPLSETFRLHSRPTAIKRIYLDFDGHAASGTAWGGTIVTPAFSLDSDYTAFSDSELTRIQDVWARVVEDFVPFDVDVTTEAPTSADLINSGGGDTRWGVRVVVGGDGAWRPGAAGVAFVNGFGRSDLAPAFVFADQWWKSRPNFIATCISHEVGHTLGLRHHGYQDSEYYGGRGNWGPLMGNPDRLLTQWSNGDYGDSTNQQNDLAVITTRAGNGFGYRPDDHGNSLVTATVHAGTDLSGLIERSNDVDLFRFYTSSRITANIRTVAAGANLDVLAEILDAAGTVVATSDPLNSLAASFTMTVNAGNYFLRVQGTGQGDPATTGYSRYGSLGQYTVELTVDAQPRILSVEDRVGATQGAVPNGGLTDDRQPVVSGSGVPGATVTLMAGTTNLGVATISPAGGWSLIVTLPLADGTHGLMAEDSVGGTSDTPYAITVDTAAPAVPRLANVRDDAVPVLGAVAPGGVTNDATLLLEGRAEAGATVIVLNKGVPIGSATANLAGSWGHTTTALVDGTHVFTVVARDAAGNDSLPTPSYAVTVDRSPPPAPTIAAITDAVAPNVGTVASGGFTNDRLPRIAGTAEPDSQVRVSIGTLLAGTTTAGLDGSWAIDVTTPLAVAPHAIVASSVDAAGNISPLSAAYLLTVDTAPPSMMITHPGPDVLTIGGISTVTFTVSEPVSTFTANHVRVTGGFLSAFSGAGTTYSATFTPHPGFHGLADISVSPAGFRDQAGHPNSGATLSLRVDTVAPTMTMTLIGPPRLIAGYTAQVVFTLSEPSPAFGTDSVIVTGGSVGPFEAVGDRYVATFTPQAGFRGAATITVPVGTFTDANANPNASGDTLAIAVDTVIPGIAAFAAGFTGTTLHIGDSLPLEARITDPVTQGGRFTVTFDSGGRVELVVDDTGLVARGTYLVQAGERSDCLEVVAVAADQALGNAAGNPFATGTPWSGATLSEHHAIVVDGTVRLATTGAFSIDPALVRDVRSQFRTVPIRFTTPVRGVSLRDFVLTLNGQRLPLAGARLLGTGTTYSLQLPITRVNPIGIYRLSIVPGSVIRALSNGAVVTPDRSLHWGNGRSIGMVPDAPTAVIPTAGTASGRSSSVALSWRAPQGNGGGVVTHYEVQHRPVGSTRWVTTRLHLPGSVTAAIVSGLTPGLSYEFRIAAVNAAGQGVFGVSAPFRVA